MDGGGQREKRKVVEHVVLGPVRGLKKRWVRYRSEDRSGMRYGGEGGRNKVRGGEGEVG